MRTADIAHYCNHCSYKTYHKIPVVNNGDLHYEEHPWCNKYKDTLDSIHECILIIQDKDMNRRYGEPNENFG